MTKNERDLASKMLDLASECFANHGCTDFDNKFWESWTDEEKYQFRREYSAFFSDNDEDDLYLEDWCIMKFLAYKLRKE